MNKPTNEEPLTIAAVCIKHGCPASADMSEWLASQLRVLAQFHAKELERIEQAAFYAKRDRLRST